jgi:4-hydroxy-4-methyl-2-oxoglutarate aldolase
MTTYDLKAAELLRLGAATLGEAGGHPLSPRIRAAWQGASIAAVVFTARCSPGDNLAIHVAVAEAPEAHALLVDVGDEPEFGYWGEVLTVAAQARRLAGLVTNGCVRDTSALRRLAFPVYSAGVALRGASKDRPGGVGGTVTIDGVDVAPGDWVVADGDGVTVVSSANLEGVVAAGHDRATKEEVLLRELRAGATTLELLGLDEGRISRG